MKPLYSHDIDPVLLPIDLSFIGLGELKIRFYGLLFGLAAIMALFFLRYLFKKKNYTITWVEDYIIYLLIGVVVGSRLIHVIFYSPDYFFSNPIEILKIWKGGIASHGATLGAIVGALLFTINKKITFLQLADLTAIPAALGTVFIRLGNFINGEIVGRVTDVSWAISYKYLEKKSYGYKISNEVFDFYKSQLTDNPFIKKIFLSFYSLNETQLKEYLAPNLAFEKAKKFRILVSELPRHPSQIYEMIYGIILFLILFFVFKKYKDKLIDGTLFALFFIIYFSFRFVTEFVKEYQAFAPEESFLTMGQYLSLPFILVGFLFLIYLFRKKSKI